MVERFNGCVSKRLKSGFIQPMTLRQSSFTNGMCIIVEFVEMKCYTNGITENEKKKNEDEDMNAYIVYKKNGQLLV